MSSQINKVGCPSLSLSLSRSLIGEGMCLPACLPACPPACPPACLYVYNYISVSAYVLVRWWVFKMSNYHLHQLFISHLYPYKLWSSFPDYQLILAPHHVSDTHHIAHVSWCIISVWSFQWTLAEHRIPWSFSWRSPHVTYHHQS